MKPLSVIMASYQNGDYIPTDELTFFHSEIKKLADLSRQFGERFAIQTVYAERIEYNCRKFLESRLSKSK